MMRFWSVLTNWLPLLLGSLVLISAGLYNGFPLVTSDSGTYINSAIQLTVPDDRPITYGLFILITGFKKSLWFVVFAQGLLLAWLLLAYIKLYVPRLQNGFGRLALLGLTAWLTGVSWFCSQLMPDIFTAIGVLALGLLLLDRTLTWPKRVALLATTLVAAIMHSSNLLTFSLMLIGFGLAAWSTRLFKRGLLQRTHYWVATAVICSGWLVLPALHAGFGGGFTLSRASSAFLVARLVETGIIDKFLSQNCGAANEYKLCAFRDKLPNDAITFMWDENAPLNQTGGWNANQAEYQAILRHIALTPRYYPFLLSESIQATFRQLTHISHGDGLTPFRENSNPYWKVNEYASYELKEYMSSMQNRGVLTFETLNERVYGGYLLSLFFLGLLLSYPALRSALPPSSILLLVLLGIGIVCNAFVTGGLANVLDRLQARVAWLLPFAAILLGAQQWPSLLRHGLRAFREAGQERAAQHD